jgi:large subunit ribosomal protein L6
MINLCNNHRYLIKIPTSISVLYCDFKQILFIKSNFDFRIIQVKTKLIISTEDNLIKVTNISSNKISYNQHKRLKSLQGLTVALIRQAFLEVSTNLCKKLKLIGVGYRIFIVKNVNMDILHLKLGYSHSIYFKIPKQVFMTCRKSTKLFISGNLYNFVSQVAAYIRAYKTIEPYKGKGILYENEKIILKEGKKV